MPPNIPPPPQSTSVVRKELVNIPGWRFTIREITASTRKYITPISAPQRNFLFFNFFPVIKPAKKVANT